MAFTPEEKQLIYKACNRCLNYHHPRTVEQEMREIADSPYAQMAKDQYGQGGFLSEFESEIAAMLGKEAAVFMPSGTMAQQIALRIWCDRAGSNRVAFHPTCHLEIHEQGAYRELHHLEAELLGEKDRLFGLADLQAMTNKPAAILIELPQREIGGQLPSWVDLQDICTWAKERDIRLHLDGARLWECRPYYDRPLSEIAAPFDSVYVSFYKILNGLPGAMLAGPRDFIDEAKIWQRRHGGNLYQLYPNAISAKLGMQRHLNRIPDYCRKAASLAKAFSEVEGIRIVPEEPPTNMMHLFLKGDREALEEAAWETARDTKVFVFGRLGSTDDPHEFKIELSVGDATLDISDEEAASLLRGIVGRVSAPVS